jgi:hypothetical protein
MASEPPPSPITTNFVLNAWLSPYTNSEPPPSPITDGFNPTAWTPAPYNEITANRTFLRKVVPDTANVVETLTSVRTTSIQPTTASGTLQIGTVSTEEVQVGYVASRTGTITIGTRATVGTHFGNGVDATNNVNILNGNYGAGIVAGSLTILSNTDYSATSDSGKVNIQNDNNKGSFSVGNTNSSISFDASVANISNLSVSYPITLGDVSLPIASGKVGTKVDGVLVSVGLTGIIPTANINYDCMTLSLTSGTWIVIAHQSMQTATNNGWSFHVSNASAQRPILYAGGIIRTFSTTVNPEMSIMATVQNTGTQTYYIVTRSNNVASVTISNLYAYAYKIC